MFRRFFDGVKRLFRARKEADKAVERSRAVRRRAEHLVSILCVLAALAACASRIEPGAAAENALNVRVISTDCHDLAVRAGLDPAVVAALDARNAIAVALAEEIAAKAGGE